MGVVGLRCRVSVLPHIQAAVSADNVDLSGGSHDHATSGTNIAAAVAFGRSRRSGATIGGACPHSYRYHSGDRTAQLYLSELVMQKHPVKQPIRKNARCVRPSVGGLGTDKAVSLCVLFEADIMICSVPARVLHAQYGVAVHVYGLMEEACADVLQGSVKVSGGDINLSLASALTLPNVSRDVMSVCPGSWDDGNNGRVQFTVKEVLIECPKHALQLVG